MIRLITLLFCDPVGIRTQDPQLRRLLLYPAELPDQSECGGARLRRFQLQSYIKILIFQPIISEKYIFAALNRII